MNEEKMDINDAIEILDGFLWYNKIYDQDILSDAWSAIRSEFFDNKE